MPLDPLLIPGTALGCGAVTFRPGYYTLGTNFDGRYGGPGPREVVDLTGIPAGYRVRDRINHGDLSFLLLYNDTDTLVFKRSGSTWVKAQTAVNPTFAAVAGTGMVSFRDVLAVGFNTAAAYQFSTDDGATWTASTKTAAEADRFKFAVVQVNGLTAPRVTYCVDSPTATLGAALYFTEDLTNGDATGSTATYINDRASDQERFGNLVEDYTGEILCCMRHDIYSVDSAGRVWRRTWENFSDGIADAGGQSDRINFEIAIKLNGRIYFNYSGSELLEWDRGRINKYFAPKHLSGGVIPRMDLPINAGCAAGGYLLLALGSKNTATLKSVVYAAGGAAHIGNVFTTASELYMGRYEDDTFAWHGILLLCTDPLRFMWYDEDDDYVYLASGDSEAADAQQRRFIFYKQNPYTTLTASNVVLNTGTWKCDLGRIDFGSPFALKVAKHVQLSTLGLGVPTLALLHKLTPGYETGAFVTLKTFDLNAEAEIGVDFPPAARALFRTMHLELDGVGDATNNAYAVFLEGLLEAELASEPQRPYRRR